MGLFDQCICCPCLSKEQSVKVCTYIMIAFTALSVIYSVITTGVGLGDVIQVGLIISLIFLLIGISNGKKSYLKQFDTVFGLLVVLESFSIFYIIVVGVIAIGAALYVDNKNGSQKEIDVGDEIGKETKVSAKYAVAILVIEMVVILIYYILTLYYYITTRRYVIERVKEIENENEVKQLENGAK